MACQNKSRVWDNGWCNVACRYCTLTQEITCEHNKQTNADLIRAMSDEELTREIFLRCDCPNCPLYGKCGGDNKACTERILHWLQQPAEEVLR